MKKPLLLLGGMLAVSGIAQAQYLQTGYVTNPESSQLHTYINAWNDGKGSISIDSKVWEDEEFFTSRVKPRTRIVRYGAGDVNNLTDVNEKRIMWWVPIGDPSFWAIPNALYDSEVFSCWSYIDHFGSFSNPYGWVDGAFADAAHKNGVAVTGQASVPNTSLPAGWATCFDGMKNITDADHDKVGKFLLYHGVDGLAYNSEFSGGGAAVPGLRRLHSDLMAYMADKNPIFENIWYDGTTDGGGLSFDTFLSGKTELFKHASMFSNYNWNTTNLSNVLGRATEARPDDPRAAFYYYAGCNMQGGEPRGYSGAYERIGNTNVSLGYWGAHSRNMFWEGRGAGGTSSLARQQYYLNQCETFFTNGVRNPAVHLATINNKAHRPSENWQGISTYRNAASSINHTISQEAFYSFFNLGNGTFFNWKGKRISDNEWYSLGIQDFMPTWRFWFAPKFMQATVTKGTQGMQADFTWEDAYVGGSCLKISGSATTEYLHLFKSAIIPNANNKVVVRYRLLNGEADINLVLSTGNAPSTVKHTLKGVLTVAESSDKADQGFDINSDDRWVTKVFNLTQVQANQYKSANGGIGVIALEFKNAKNLEILLGEIGIYPSGSATVAEDAISNSATPAAPQITKTTILASNQYGVDAKMVWTLDGGAGRAAGTPVYNADKGVSMFKMYAQEEGGEETFMGVTTSWAGLMYKCPVTLGSNKRVRFGVSAVSADTRSESAISWSAYMAKPDYALNENITIDKPVLKANESFSFGYVDPMHEPSTWTLVDESGKTVLTETGQTINVPNGLPNEGGYTLYIDRGTDSERVFGYYVQVSGDKVGAVPQIISVTRDGETMTDESAAVQITLDENPRLAFTGRKADGNASRAVGLASTYFGAKIGDLGINALQSLSVAGWFKFKEIPNMGWHFMNISDRTTAWPNNEWGWTWNDGTADGRYESRFRGATSGNTLGEVHYSFPDVRFQAGIWTHIAWICEYTTTPQAGFRHQLYINGVKQNGFVTAYVKGNGTEGNTAVRTVNGVTYDGTVSSDTFVWGQTFPIGSNEYVYFGGPKHQEAAVDGVVDDFQVWNKAMSQDDVNASMNGFPGGYPEGLLSIWDFEDNYGDDFTFKSKGAKTGVSCSTFQTEVIKNEAGQETGSRIISIVSGFEAGCPFLSGTAMPVETKATWSDNFRQTNFDTNFVGETQGEGGTAVVEFNDEGDHNVKLSLENLYGKDEFEFPIFTVSALAGIGEVDADGEGFDAYTEGNVLFLEFASDGVYDVQVYNVGGMLIASKELSALAGQSAQVSLGAAGVYLVKAVKDGQVLRTVKVLSK